MRNEKLVLRAFVVITLVAAGCGSGANTSGDGGTNTGGFDVNKLLRACTILHSCPLNYEIAACVFDFNRGGTPAQVDCVLAASVADCSAANACIGVKLAPADSNCVDRCLDDDTFVQCGTSTRSEITCSSYLKSAGPHCISSATTAGCGIATCSADGEYTCDGMVSHSCGSGIERMDDCARVGAECTSNGCQLPTPGPCMTLFGCQGDQLLTCDGTGTGVQRVEDCSKVVPDGTCIVVNNFQACGWGMECDLSIADRCIGTTLRACVLGAFREVDCTAVGGTKCELNPNAPGSAMCSP